MRLAGLTNISNIPLNTGGLVQANQAYSSVSSRTSEQLTSDIKQPEESVTISQEARVLQQEFNKDKSNLEENYNRDAQALERAYQQEKSKLEREFSQKKQALEVNIYA